MTFNVNEAWIFKSYLHKNLVYVKISYLQTQLFLMKNGHFFSARNVILVNSSPLDPNSSQPEHRFLMYELLEVSFIFAVVHFFIIENLSSMRNKKKKHFIIIDMLLKNDTLG
jgi:hypothetical protein